MTTAPAPSPPLPGYRWTRNKLTAFTSALAATGSVAAAARAVGMSRQSAYRLRQQLGPDFAALWDDIIATARARRHCPPAPHDQPFFRKDRVNLST